MNNRSTLIAIVCGLLTALFFLAPLTLGSLGMAMSTFTALPLFVSALGFGTVAGIISGVVGAVVVAGFTGIYGAMGVGLATLLPALWIGHMVGLSRDDTGTTEWFPVSTILFRMALMAAVITILIGVIAGYSDERTLEQTREILKQFAADASELAQTEEQQERMAQSLVRIVPFVAPVSLLLLMIINLLLGARIARAQGWMLRPKTHLPSETALPQIAVAVFAAAVVGSFVPGSVGLVAKVVAGAMAGAFLLVGLATAHTLTMQVPARGMMLVAMYVLLTFSRFLALAMALLGVAETLFQLRARRAAPPSNSNNSNT
ncbi:MAG: DUF2232 domain-containing protein [Pseudomonadota bacterium]